MPKPSSSARVDERPVPNSTRPLRDEVERRDRLSAVRTGWLYGFGQQADAVADAQVLGHRRDVAVQHLGVGAVRVLVEEVVLDRPEGVKAHPVAELHLLDRVAVRLVLVRPGVHGFGTGIS